MEECHSEWRRSDLIARTLQQSPEESFDLTQIKLFHRPLSGKSVGLSRKPVNMAVIIEASWQAAVCTATNLKHSLSPWYSIIGLGPHLGCEVAHPLHHPAEQAAVGVGGQGVDRLASGEAGEADQERGEQRNFHNLSQHVVKWN